MKRETEQFKEDYLHLQPAMQRMAERLLGDETEAEDVVQDCFVTLWQQRRELRRVVNREAWCVTLVKRRCIDVLRHRRPTVPVDDQALSSLQPDPAADERLDLALHLVDRLPARQAEAVRLRHIEALETKEIAREMVISEGNVYVLLSRAYNNMKQMIAEYENKR